LLGSSDGDKVGSAVSDEVGSNDGDALESTDLSKACRACLSRGDMLLTLDVITNADEVAFFKGSDREYTERMLQIGIDG